jgi:hypothetical protein
MHKFLKSFRVSPKIPEASPNPDCGRISLNPSLPNELLRPLDAQVPGSVVQASTGFFAEGTTESISRLHSQLVLMAGTNG